MPCPNAIEKQQTKACGLCCTRLEDFGVRVGRTEILRDINLHIHCGELMALIGPNGAGKTTLLKAILGEIPHTGYLRFLNASNCQARKPIVGYVPQKIDFDAGAPVSVLDLFSAALSSRPVCLGHSRSLQELTEASLLRVRADHLLKRRLGDLSGGELQRVLLALALEPKPDLLLMDEPVSGIDVQGREMFYYMVSDLRRNYDLSIILVSHDLALVSQYAERVVLLNKTVICDGTPEDVFSNGQINLAYGPFYIDSTSGKQAYAKKSGGAIA